MKRMAPIVTLSIGALALTGCGGGDSDQERIDELEAQVEELSQSTEAEEPTAEDAAQAPTQDVDEADLDAGEPMQTIDLGESFVLYDSNYEGGWIDVTWDAFEWVDPSAAEGEENYGIAVFTIENDSEGPVDLPAPIDGGGWHYKSADGVIESTFQQTTDWGTTYEGRVASWHSGPFLAGTTEAGLTTSVIPDERGGELAFVSPEGFIDVALTLPEGETNSDDETIREIYDIANDGFDGEVAERY